MGMEGSWSGAGGGGYREYFLVKMLEKDLGFQSFLLFGTGNTATLGRLISEGVDVVGCDISQDVVAYKRQQHGNSRFHPAEEIPSHLRFDAIVAVEVFEHFAAPNESWRVLTRHLNDGGIICGTTNFYPGGPIEDSNDPGYMSLKGHVAYWSQKSLGYLARTKGFKLEAFEMVRPGSVLPDEKFGQLWPNKRVFFLFPAGWYEEYFSSLRDKHAILPIDKP